MWVGPVTNPVIAFKVIVLCLYIETNPGSNEADNAKGSQKHKKKHSYKTIEQNLNNITYSMSDMKCEVSLFFLSTVSERCGCL